MHEAELLLDGASQMIRALDPLTADANAGKTVRIGDEPGMLGGEQLLIRLDRERAAADSETLLSIAVSLRDVYTVLEAVLERLGAPSGGVVRHIPEDTDAVKRERDPLGEWYSLGTLSVDRTEVGTPRGARCPLTLGHSKHKWWNSGQSVFLCPGIVASPDDGRVGRPKDERA
jgi:hypothetical protein